MGDYHERDRRPRRDDEGPRDGGRGGRGGNQDDYHHNRSRESERGREGGGFRGRGNFQGRGARGGRGGRGGGGNSFDRNMFSDHHSGYDLGKLVPLQEPGIAFPAPEVEKLVLHRARKQDIPQGDTPLNCKRINLVTNLFTINFAPKSRIFQYDVQFVPDSGKRMLNRKYVE
jgi:hypothetical protein